MVVCIHINIYYYVQEDTVYTMYMGLTVPNKKVLYTIAVDVVLYVVMPHVVDVVMPHQVKHACCTAHIRNDKLTSSVL